MREKFVFIALLAIVCPSRREFKGARYPQLMRIPITGLSEFSTACRAARQPGFDKIVING